MITVAAIVLNIFHPGMFFEESRERIKLGRKGKDEEHRYDLCVQCRRMRPHHEFSISKMPDGYGEFQSPPHGFDMARMPDKYGELQSPPHGFAMARLPDKYGESQSPPYEYDMARMPEAYSKSMAAGNYI